MKNSTLFLSFLTFVLIVAASCTSPEPESVTSKTYDVSDFTSLNLELIGDVYYEQSDSSYFNASGSSSLINALAVANSNGRLSIELDNKKKYSESKKELVIKVGSPRLEAVNFESIGTLHLKNKIKIDRLDITNEGIGHVKIDDCHVRVLNISSKSVGLFEVKGIGDELNLNSEGVGKIDCSEFRAKNAEVVSKGTGTISVFASENLDITLKGLSNVDYYGNPKNVETDISGMGKATRRD